MRFRRQIIAISFATSLFGVIAPRANSSPSFSSGVASPACAPWDGAAIHITLTDGAPGGETNPDGTYPMISLALWKLPLADGAVLDTAGKNEAEASYCSKKGACETAVGKIRIKTVVDKKPTAGSFDLKGVKPGQHWQGEFHSVWKDAKIMCG